MDSSHKVSTDAKQHDHGGLNASQVDVLRRGRDSIVRAQCNQTNEILELIPSSKLQGDLPKALVDGHVHWLNLSTKIIEIRPLTQPWEESSENWRIGCASGQYRMYKGRIALVDIRSPTWEMASGCFKCLNCRLLITTSPIDSVQFASMQRLCVTLPRYGLSFFVNETEDLESRDFKHMVYDENRCVGALLGLENLLVLRPKTQIAGVLVPEAFIPRRVLIPKGFPKTHGNNQAHIESDGFRSPDGPLYYTYDVDTELGCLIGNGSANSMQFLAYVHAMTGCHRPDPLTGKTGAQAAVCLLQSAGCRSIMQLKAVNDDRPTDPKYWLQLSIPKSTLRTRKSKIDITGVLLIRIRSRRTAPPRDEPPIYFLRMLLDQRLSKIAITMGAGI